MTAPDELRTPRLRLRRPQLADAEAIYRGYACDPEVARYVTWRPHAAVAETRQLLLQYQASWTGQREFNWVIETTPAAELIGMIGVGLNTFRAGLGYVLARPFWRCGYATEAARAVVDWAGAAPELYRVWAVCDVDNAAPRRVLEKLGLAYEGVLHRWIVHPNLSPEPRDCLCFARCR